MFDCFWPLSAYSAVRIWYPCAHSFHFICGFSDSERTVARTRPQKSLMTTSVSIWPASSIRTFDRGSQVPTEAAAVATVFPQKARASGSRITTWYNRRDTEGPPFYHEPIGRQLHASAPRRTASPIPMPVYLWHIRRSSPVCTWQ